MHHNHARPSLTSWVKAGYGSAELGITAVEFFIQVYLLKFYVSVVGLQPGLAGLVLAVGMIWDAITDPLLGAISDETRSRWGKRRPYIALGAPILAAFFVLLFQPPEWEGQTAKAGFLLVVYILVNTAMTLVAVPHMALGGELSQDPSERTRIFGWRFLFANLGLILAILLPAFFTSGTGEGSPEKASWLIAIALIFSAWLSVRVTKSFDHPRSSGKFTWQNFFKGLLNCAKNPVFWPLLLAFIVGNIGRTLNASIALFYYELRLQLTEQDVFLYILLPFTFVISLSILSWTKLADSWGKRTAAFWGILLLGIMTCAVYPFLPPGHLTFPILVGIVGGFLVGSVFLLDATVSDVADFDEWKNGEKREGLYFGVWRLSSKLARALGLAGSGFMLDLLGYDQSLAQQSESFTQSLGWLFGPGVGGFFVLAALGLLLLPLNKRRIRILAKAVNRRRKRPSPSLGENKLDAQTQDGRKRNI